MNEIIVLELNFDLFSYFLPLIKPNVVLTTGLLTSICCPLIARMETSINRSTNIVFQLIKFKYLPNVISFYNLNYIIATEENFLSLNFRCMIYLKYHNNHLIINHKFFNEINVIINIITESTVNWIIFILTNLTFFFIWQNNFFILWTYIRLK